LGGLYFYINILQNQTKKKVHSKISKFFFYGNSQYFRFHLILCFLGFLEEKAFVFTKSCWMVASAFLGLPRFFMASWSQSFKQLL
jgi:superfamily II DNA/RNA helicase